MFGYILVNKPEMKYKEFERYQSFYCGLCHELKRKYGRFGQMTLSYDLTFLILLLTSLYEPEIRQESHRCLAHPFEKHRIRRNQFSVYAADMNVLLTYYKCEDDWLDERKLHKKLFALLLKRKIRRIEKEYPKKAQVVKTALDHIHVCEKAGSTNIDTASGFFGEVMAEIFAVYEDEWEHDLRKIGFYLGKFIYLADAYEDIRKDEKKGNYNPFCEMAREDDFEEKSGEILKMMMAECAKTFERLPLLTDTEILRNILYAGVWSRYETVKRKREEAKKKAGEQQDV